MYVSVMWGGGGICFLVLYHSVLIWFATQVLNIGTYCHGGHFLLYLWPVPVGPWMHALLFQPQHFAYEGCTHF